MPLCLELQTGVLELPPAGAHLSCHVVSRLLAGSGVHASRHTWSRLSLIWRGKARGAVRRAVSLRRAPLQVLGFASVPQPPTASPLPRQPLCDGEEEGTITPPRMILLVELEVDRGTGGQPTDRAPWDMGQGAVLSAWPRGCCEAQVDCVCREQQFPRIIIDHGLWSPTCLLCTRPSSTSNLPYRFIASSYRAHRH